MILSILITRGHRSFTSTHWAWEMFYSENEMRRTRNMNEPKQKHWINSSFPSKSVLITHCKIHLGWDLSNLNSNKYIYTCSIITTTGLVVIFIFGLFFNYLASRALHATPLRMLSLALYSKMAGKTFVMTHKLQHARYSYVLKAAEDITKGSKVYAWISIPLSQCHGAVIPAEL